MEKVLITPVDSPALFYLLAITLLCILVVSIARIAERAGVWLPNLATHNIFPKFFIAILLTILWLYLTYIAFILTYSLGLVVLLVGGNAIALLYPLLIILIYLTLTLLLYYWSRGDFISAGIMTTLIVSLSAFVLLDKRGWVCKPLAESGVSIAYGCLAHAYEYPGGKGLPVDESKMHYWYERAAKAGNSEAVFRVALKTKDPVLRETLLKQAAENGNINAAHRYSQMVKDPELAMHWLNYAANRGQADALFDLGHIYYTGKGTNKDFSKTRKLWQQAAEAGSLRAMFELASGYAKTNVLFERDVELSEKWEERGLVRKQELEKKWVKHPASMQVPPYDSHLFRHFEDLIAPLAGQRRNDPLQDNPKALAKLAEGYLDNISGDPSLRIKAIEIYRSLAEKNDAEAAYALSRVLLKDGGKNTEEQSEGRRWLITAAERNHQPAIDDLIDAYENGQHGFSVDLEKAKIYSERKLGALLERPNTTRSRHAQRFAYYRTQELQEKIDQGERHVAMNELLAPASQGDASAQFQLAHLLMVEHKVKESLAWREKAAENGHADAQYLEAQRITSSSLQKQYAQKAFDYYLSAAGQNHPGALAAMGDIYRQGYRRLKIEKNLYLSKIYYQKALSLAQGEIIYKNTFGNPRMTSYASAKFIRQYLDELPDAIRRLDLEGLSPQQKEEKINSWYYSEIERLKPGEKSADTLNLLNEQRDVLLEDLQKP